MTQPRQLRKIPSVSQTLEELRKHDWSREYMREQLVNAVRHELSELRLRLKQSTADTAPALEDLMQRVRKRLEHTHSYSLKKVINATGVIIHTNLGRAPLSADAIAHLTEIARGYNNLEFDILEGMRGSREIHTEKLLTQLLPVEASLVVNNNAAALLLILNTFAEGKEVLVSRGELVEIGGSFRLPEIMKKSGAILREIGTTNKTRLEDYRNAISERTGLILVVHPSNYQIIGFTERPSLKSIAALGKQHSIPVAEDHGSGILFDLAEAGIPEEPDVAARLAEGIDLICFSGDKILGGPQAGIVCGLISRIGALRKNPLFRALRVDKMVYAALEATLLLYLRGQRERIPVLRMLFETAETLEHRAAAWLLDLQTRFPECLWQVESTLNYIGGGVAPMKGLPSCAISFSHPNRTAEQIAHALRESDPPVIARIEEDRLFFELRTLTPQEQETIAAALEKFLKS